LNGAGANAMSQIIYLNNFKLPETVAVSSGNKPVLTGWNVRLSLMRTATEYEVYTHKLSDNAEPLIKGS